MNKSFIKIFIKNNFYYIVFNIIFALLSVLINLLLPIYQSYVIDLIVSNKVSDDILFSKIINYYNLTTTHLIIGLIILFVLNFATSLLFVRYANRLGEKFAYRLRKTLYTHIQTLPYDYFKSIPLGEIIHKCVSDVNIVMDFIKHSMIYIITSLLTIIISIIIVSQLNIIIGISFIITVCIVIFVIRKFITKQTQIFTNYDDLSENLTDYTSEFLNGIRVIRSYNKESIFLKQFNKHSQKLRKSVVDLLKGLGFYETLLLTLTRVHLLIIVIASIYLYHQNMITIGMFYVFVTYQSKINDPLIYISYSLGHGAKAVVAYKRIKTILNQPQEQDNATKQFNIQGSIEFKNVSLKYDKQVLHNLTFKINKNESVAIMGSTGSGKSSLVKLLHRYYEHNGDILIDNENINNIKKTTLRSQIALIPQNIFLFNKTIKDNLTIASNEKHYEKATKLASIHDEINRFEDKYDTLIGEKGVSLSGGQKQRIAIATVLMKKYPILIFDDSLSALDNESETNILENLQQQQATKLIVTHKITTAKKCDKIIVLEKGKILEMGTHTELIKNKLFYYELNAIYEGGLHGRNI